jgi:hypothetical protein
MVCFQYPQEVTASASTADDADSKRSVRVLSAHGLNPIHGAAFFFGFGQVSVQIVLPAVSAVQEFQDNNALMLGSFFARLE